MKGDAPPAPPLLHGVLGLRLTGSTPFTLSLSCLFLVLKAGIPGSRGTTQPYSSPQSEDGLPPSWLPQSGDFGGAEAGGQDPWDSGVVEAGPWRTEEEHQRRAEEEAGPWRTEEEPAPFRKDSIVNQGVPAWDLTSRQFVQQVRLMGNCLCVNISYFNTVE